MKNLIKFIPLFLVLSTVTICPYSCTRNADKTESCISEGNVRHVILWTLADNLSVEEKQEAISLAKSSMAQFAKDFDGIIKAEVISEKRLGSSNCDFMFDMYFKDAAALKEFSSSPDHLAVASRLKPFICGRTCLDVEL